MKKKTIKINYCGFWDDFDPRFNLINSVLKERYYIEISDKPDFVFCCVNDHPGISEDEYIILKKELNEIMECKYPKCSSFESL